MTPAPRSAGQINAPPSSRRALRQARRVDGLRIELVERVDALLHVAGGLIPGVDVAVAVELIVGDVADQLTLRADVILDDVELPESALLGPEGGGLKIARVEWALLGEHNQLNALATIAAAEHVGVEPEVAATALATFEKSFRGLDTFVNEQATDGIAVSLALISVYAAGFGVGAIG